VVHRSGSVLSSLLDDSRVIAACSGRVTLFSIYVALKELLAELASLYPAKGLPEPLPYDHDNPYPPFRDLDRKIRSYLGGVTGPTYRKVDFHLVENVGRFYADFRPDFFPGATGFYLAVEGPLDAGRLTQLVTDPDLFKLQPRSYETRALFGMKLTEERHPPPELPYTGKRFFYRVTEDAKVWEQFKKEAQGVVHFGDDDVGKYDQKSFRIALYATLPNTM
jgi:predicted component of type VI protein secretion system